MVPPARYFSPALLSTALVAVTLLAPAAAVAQDTVPPPPSPQRQHVVRPGDTLWELARAYLQDPFLWPLLFDANRGLLSDPDLILPEQRLVIPVTKPGEPIGEPVVEAPPPAPEAAPAPLPVDTPAPAPEPPPPPLAVRPGEWTTAPWLSDTTLLARVGRIVSKADPGEGGSTMLGVLLPFDRVWVGQLAAVPAAVGDTLLVVRFDDAPDGWGRMIVPTALLQVDTVGATVLGARVTHQYADAKVGERTLLWSGVPELPRVRPVPVPDGPEGVLLAFESVRPTHSTLHTGFVDVGADQGVGVGDEFEAYAAAGDDLPLQTVARMRVIRVEPTSATVLVTALDAVALRAGLPVRLVGRMQ